MITNRFAGFADNGGVPVEKFTPAVAHTAKPKNPKKPISRLAGNVAIDDEDGEIAEAKKGISMADYDISRGPYHAILDKLALARQAQTGESYAKAFMEIYEAPENVLLRDGAAFDHLAKAMDATHGTKLSLIPKVEKAAPPDPLQKAADVAEFFGPAHAKMHSLAIDHQRAHSGMSYQQAYSHLYTRPENEALRNAIKAEHMRATMARANG
jgi:hypothetical protein